MFGDRSRTFSAHARNIRSHRRVDPSSGVNGGLRKSPSASCTILDQGHLTKLVRIVASAEFYRELEKKNRLGLTPLFVPRRDWLV
ncbi:hypothetical protein M378DRAFT_642503 [Amanita muscaria Koide BX008]|uniref:Uncharacterized protein n=1 Tax=Amanita muscaria (strain Koide BX008) TaxID=946122 RepID=A0A0C2TBF0_AMAMK|nr:hypothetical protein M378DRAFT_642503 [Amanita muscaria Koide BX008]